jgi:vacuolar-type H+-ATPase subunit H
MGDGALNRLLETEKEAQLLVDKARDQAKRIVEQAEKEAVAFKKAGLNEFHTKKARTIENSQIESRKEAEKIRSDGIELAKGLAGRSKTRIPMAVDKVLEMLLEDQ